MKHKLLILASVLALSSCNPTTYTIPSGDHYSGIHFGLFTSTGMKFTAMFDNSAIYQTTSPADQDDINKLYGFTDCFSLVHSNSARFGWRWYNDKLEIDAYTYVGGGDHISQTVGFVKPNESHDYSIQIQGAQYIFTLDNLPPVTMARGCTSANADGYRLYPYFGGTETAPHQVTIYIDETSLTKAEIKAERQDPHLGEYTQEQLQRFQSQAESE